MSATREPEALKACPFCGGSEAEVMGSDGGTDYEDEGVLSEPCWWVTCCGCITSRGNFKTREDAIAAWNRRPAPPPAAAGWVTVTDDPATWPPEKADSRVAYEYVAIDGITEHGSDWPEELRAEIKAGEPKRNGLRWTWWPGSGASP